jgi:hypothetical protein
MNTLLHSCGSRVDFQLETLNPKALGQDSVTLFTDAVTDDPITHCPGCGACLADALQARQLKLMLPTGQRPGTVAKAGKRTGDVRASAIRAVRTMVKDAQQRRARAAA